MSKTMKTLGLTMFFSALAWTPLLAQGDVATADPKAKLYMVSLIVAGAVITLAAAAGAFCQAKAISSACEGISRNPAGAPTIRFLLLLGLILIETLVIYALLVAFIILMVKWGQYA
ncbi:MAG: ATP synthase F0 subunit C [Candidatus Aminicenantes bacterium]|nr:ATP synthase F0 subunit C [Candidatus Aminicenantes bacterium]